MASKKRTLTKSAQDPLLLLARIDQENPTPTDLEVVRQALREERNMPRLERLIGQIGDRQQELAEIAYRAMQVPAKHEPGAERRTR